jgi:hypothetical protein
MIECHPRMGDIDLFPTLDILCGIIETYQGNKYDWSNIELKQTYYFPVWIQTKDKSKDLYDFVENNLVTKYMYDKNLFEVGYEHENLAMLSKHSRIMYFTCGEKSYGDKIINEIDNVIQDKFNVKVSR